MRITSSIMKSSDAFEHSMIKYRPVWVTITSIFSIDAVALLDNPTTPANEISDRFFFKFDVQIGTSELDNKRAELMKKYIFKSNEYLK